MFRAFSADELPSLRTFLALMQLAGLLWISLISP
jgi:hypothetical protein